MRYSRPIRRHVRGVRPRQVGAHPLLERVAVVDARARDVAGQQVEHVQVLAELDGRRLGGGGDVVACPVQVDVEVAAVPAARAAAS
ncbi:hypothetical protein GCM10020219_069280 [Nonomuraea dietziae]